MHDVNGDNILFALYTVIGEITLSHSWKWNVRGEGNNVYHGRLVTLLTSQPSTTNARFQCYPISQFSQFSRTNLSNSLLPMLIADDPFPLTFGVVVCKKSYSLPAMKQVLAYEACTPFTVACILI